MEMLDFVGAHYRHVLHARHVDYLERFPGLPRDAQCLYVRLVNRKGRVFDAKRLRYPELGDTGSLLEALHADGWTGPPELRHADAVLGFMTKQQLYRLLIPRCTGLSRSLKKDQLITFARERLIPGEILDGIDRDRILVQRRAEETRYLLFLYFGRIRDGLSQFTMRDLGLVSTRPADDAYEPRFGDRAEADEHYFFAVLKAEASHANAAALRRLAAACGSWPEPQFPGSAVLRDELALELGRRAEREGDTATARTFYALGESAQCSERLVRLLMASGARETARRHLERCLDDPRSEDEWLFASDFHARKFGGKRTSTTTDLVRAAEVVEIDESRSGSPERAVIEYFTNLGHAAYRSENQLWRTLFGLLFWEQLFGKGESARHSPFESLPALLARGSFYDEHRTSIEARFAVLDDPALARREILRTSLRHYGSPNGLFRWRRSMNDAIFALLEHAPPSAVQSVLRRLCDDYASHRYGYPDLLVIDESGLRFVEVKTDGDQLRRNQLLRMTQLREAGFRAEVVRVQWVLDPRQEYVVVDVETTGGRGEHHRVTEIGAVKVRDGRIVDRFQTLLNPQRAIPPDISRLTGITPAMVANAPVFADIADDLESFMRDAIFVAHNVEFDYGFLGREYRRLGRSFRYPKLCTCASMRKLYPGQRSYSLAALCREYDIPLKQHHRALCDAEAAARLLLLVNEKRQLS